MSEAILRGAPVSKGVAIGKAYLYRPVSYSTPEAYCKPEEASAEYARVKAAIDNAVEELESIQASFSDRDADKAMIFAAHQELLEDEELLESIEMGIMDENRTAEYGVASAFSDFIELLSMVDDPMIAARTADLQDVRNRVLRLLAGDEEKNLSRLPGDVIIVAHDLLPSDTATLDREHVLGILTEIGSGTSHSAIIARSMHLPAILGVPDALDKIEDGAMIILDAMDGQVLLDPDEAALADYRAREEAFRIRRAQIEKYIDAEPITKDGVRIDLGLNIGSDAADDNYNYTNFVGLFRSEFLYMESDHLPTEDEQFEAYRRVLQHAKGNPVTLRTLDIGGDKKLPYMPLPEEENPFMGQRALRLCLANEGLFRTQLRAAYRASVYGTLWIMFPMVGSLDDLRKAKAFANSVRNELIAEGLEIPEVPLGIMIEIPSIAMIAPLAAEEADFASVGTNDLCQYLCAADRMNAAVADCYQSFSPAMLFTLKRIVDAFNAAGKPISVCGEMGGDPMAALLLIGFGWRKLSMSGSGIAAVKEMIATHTLEEMQQIAEKALTLKTEEEVKALVKEALGA